MDLNSSREYFQRLDEEELVIWFWFPCEIIQDCLIVSSF